jgi:glycosyltransferase involved in cell wall biosynthesis
VSAPETSIVVRTFNEEAHLSALLDAIEGQRYRDFEVINVDSGSYDRTTEIARRHGARLLQIAAEDFTFGYSLNVGVRAAVGRFVVVVSAHTEPLDDVWLEKIVEPLRQSGVAMVYGRQHGTATSKLGELRDLARTFGPERSVMAPPKFFANNANSAFLRELWDEHPFDQELPGQEDIEWAKYWMERGYRVIYEPAAGIYHIHDETWKQVRRRYYREAIASRKIGVWRPRSAVGLATREAGYLIADYVAAFRRGELRSRGREILLFRVLKAHGTVSGLLDGKAMSTSSGRRDLFY